MIPADNFEKEYAKRVNWSRRNRHLAQAKFPSLPNVYIAKMAMLVESLEEFGPVFWLDAGFLFSVRYGHQVPENWEGYDSETIRTKLIPTLNQWSVEGKVCLNTFVPRNKPLRDFRPSFHGLTLVDMKRLAKKCGTVYQPEYVMAGTIFAVPTFANTLRTEFPRIWNTMFEMGRAGTEETVLTILKWKHGYNGVLLDRWKEMLW